MTSRSSDRLVPARRGFTLTELLVAMAMIVLIMVILSQAFAAGLESFRQLKASGDLAERLRTESAKLREDLDATNRLATTFITDGLRTSSVDPKEASTLRTRYEAIASEAARLSVGFGEFEQQTSDPAAKRVSRRLQETLKLIKVHAGNTITLIRLIDDD